MDGMMKKTMVVMGLGLLGLCVCLLVSCAGQRQGLVCEEIEYRLNSMSYSPDQRYYMEEELRTCREEEAKKKGSSGQSQKSIYERYASQDSTKKVYTEGDTIPAQESNDVSVSEMLRDSSGKETVSIYERYGSENPQVEQDSSAATTAEGTAVDSSSVEAIQEQ
jgi:threonine dehydrogenase-like Zn-dependent dehydrogenase